MSKSVYIHTFGCQMNVHDSEKMFGVLAREGYSAVENPGEADLIIFNTCSIRQKAEQKFYSELGRIRSLKRTRPQLKVVVAGCIAQQEGGNLFKKASHIDLVLGPQNIHTLADIDSLQSPHSALHDNPAIAEQDLPVLRLDAIKAWVTIMYGCNNFCSYCVVPYTRGRERSRPAENICREVSELSAGGCKEITLLGQNVNSYQSSVSFPGLLQRLNAIDGIQRIRFVTSHPKDLSSELIAAMAEQSKVCEHIHLPLQSGSTRILNLMNRGYTFRDYVEKAMALRDRIPGLSLTSDIIAGFPGETDRDHEDTLSALRKIEFDGIFAFKYSPRPMTKAAAMQSQVPDDIGLRRLNEILQLQDEITLRRNRALEGTIQEVLIEGASDTDTQKSAGRTPANKIVTIPSTGIRRGKIVRVEITEGRRHSLEGKLIAS